MTTAVFDWITVRAAAHGDCHEHGDRHDHGDRHGDGHEHGDCHEHGACHEHDDSRERDEHQEHMSEDLIDYNRSFITSSPCEFVLSYRQYKKYKTIRWKYKMKIVKNTSFLKVSAKMDITIEFSVFFYIL